LLVYVVPDNPVDLLAQASKCSALGEEGREDLTDGPLEPAEDEIVERLAHPHHLFDPQLTRLGVSGQAF